MVATVPDAREAERLGADVIAAQGAEAGGHRSVGVKPETPEHAPIGTMALAPQVAAAVRVPVVAAGGTVVVRRHPIADGQPRRRCGSSGRRSWRTI